MQNDTLPKMLKKQFESHGPRLVAMRKKERGIWKPYTWESYYSHVKNLCLGLMRLGMAKNDAIVVIGDNGPELFWAELGIQSANAKPALIGTHFSAETIEAIIQDLQAPLIIIQDAKVENKLRKIRSRISCVKKTIYFDSADIPRSDDSWYLSMSELVEMGRDYAIGHPLVFEKAVNETKEKDICALLYGSETRPLRSHTVLTHENLIKGVGAFLVAGGPSISDDYLAVMPATSFWEQNLALGASLLSGCKVNFCEKAETAKRDICEISPHFICCPPELLESLLRCIKENFQRSGTLIKFIYNLFLPSRLRVIKSLQERKDSKAPGRLRWWLGDVLLFRHVKRRVGLRRAKSIYTYGSSINSEAMEFLLGLGIPVKELYLSPGNRIGLVEGNGRGDQGAR